MAKSYSFRLTDPKSDSVSLCHRHYDGVETERGTVETFEIADARALHASLGEALAQAERNHAVLVERRKLNLVAKRADLERQIQAIDAELGKGG